MAVILGSRIARVKQKNLTRSAEERIRKQRSAPVTRGRDRGQSTLASRADHPTRRGRLLATVGEP